MWDWLNPIFNAGAAMGGAAPLPPVPGAIPPVVPNMAATPPPEIPGLGGGNPWDPSVPVPMPQSKPAMAPEATPGYYGGSPATNPALAPQSGAPPSTGNRLADALKGMTAPKVPDPQKVATPAPYRAPGHIQEGALLKLLQMLHGSPTVGGGLQLPSTLGQALGGR